MYAYRRRSARRVYASILIINNLNNSSCIYSGTCGIKRILWDQSLIKCPEYQGQLAVPRLTCSKENLADFLCYMCKARYFEIILIIQVSSCPINKFHSCSKMQLATELSSLVSNHCMWWYLIGN